MKKLTKLYAIPYFLWLIFFVLLPMLVLLWQSLFDGHGQFTLKYYHEFFTSGLYLTLACRSISYALLITLITLVLGYPMAYFLVKCKHRDLWLMLIILPTWVNLLLKIYAFMGLFAKDGTLNQFLHLLNLNDASLLFTATGFIIVATYIELPFMILPIYNVLVDLPKALPKASYDLGANRWQTFYYVVWPLSLEGVKSGFQAVFIPSLSLFMLTRLISGNKVMTLGTAIEQHFLVTQNWGMGATIGVILISLMVIIMWLMKRRSA